MKKPSEQETRDLLRSKIIGLGEKSIRKSYYPELQQRIAELEKTNRELFEEVAERRKAEKINDKLEEQLRQAMKMEAIGTLAGGIAHDFNNILTAIIGYTDLAQLHIAEGCKQEHCPVHDDLARLLEAGHRARDLIRQILTFSRQQKHENVPVQLSVIVREAMNMLSSTIPASIEIRENILNDDDYIMADPTQMHQIIMNLCTNGYHAMREKGGTLSVNLIQTEIDKDDLRVGRLHLQPGPYVVLEISDTGVGMDRNVLERIFDPYFTTRGESGGTGMGLAVVHGIVREHSGHISAYSEPGEGTTFRVYFPQIIGSVSRHVITQNKPLPGGRERILLVDDEEIVLNLEKSLLEKLGYSITAFQSPIEALEFFKRHGSSFDLVMTDMTMPKMNGAEFTKEILKYRPNIPVVICTGFSELINEEKARTIGACKYVMKPFILREIAAALRAVLDGGDADESPE
ncbi:hybrid sensor histidine kinase/response regulator [Desulfopila inferna]|uniref:hybrid sensor histidine kinase/response regulator n=1 Tax=Desulfopila inferna TaxID=468528 RepID=UPI0019644FCB|nr:response regulator [Desulfopila inferna]MBM9604561.1 response regulator [Desulfopila inferna]